MTDSQLERIAHSATRKIYNMVSHRGVDYDAIYAYALIGANRGRDKYDASRGKRLDHYVWLCAFRYAYSRTIWAKTGKLNRALLVRQFTADTLRGLPVMHEDKPPIVTADDIEKAFNVSPDEAEVMHLRYVQGYSQDEVSDILGIPIATIQSRCQRGREHARKLGYDIAKERLECA